MNGKKNHIGIKPNKKRTFLILFFVLLLILLIILIIIGIKPEKMGNVKISLSEAKELTAHYRATISSDIEAKYLAYYLDRDQIEAIDSIFKRESVNLKYFQLDFGSSDDGQYLIAKGILVDGNVIEDEIWRTDRVLAGFCPHLCDPKGPLHDGGAHMEYLTSALPSIISGISLNVGDAKIFTAYYQSRGIITRGDIESILVSIEQLKLIKSLYQKYENIKGFAFYMASNGAGNPEYDNNVENDEAIFILIAPFDADRRLILDWGYYFTSTNFAGLCPRFCD